MAMTNIDIGALIAGSIDRFVEQLEREAAYLEQERHRTTTFIEPVVMPLYIEGRNIALKLEAGGSDEGDEADKWLAMHDPERQQPSSPEAGEDEPPSSEPARPARRAPRQAAEPEHKPNYRRGYQAGWKAAKEGRPAEPPSQDPEYVAGYQAGHKVSGHANAVTKHYDAAIAAQQAGDTELAKQHVANAAPNVNELVQHHTPYWGRALKIQPRQFGDGLATMMAKEATVQKTRHGEVIAGERTPIVDAIHKLTKKFNDAPDEAAKADHPSDFGLQLGKMIAKAGVREGQEVRRKAARGEGGKGGEGGPGMPERAVGPQISMAEYKEELERQAFGKNAIEAHNNGNRHDPNIQAFRDHPHEHHEEARQHAHDIWKKGIADFIKSAVVNNEDHPLFKGKYATGIEDTANPQSKHLLRGPEVEFDPAKYLLDRLEHPAGFAGYGADIQSIQKQMGPNFRWGSSVKLDKAGLPVGPKIHPAAGQLTGVVGRANTWLHENYPPSHPDHPMWDHHFGLLGKEVPGTFRRRGKKQERSAEDKQRDLRARMARRGQVKLNIRKAAEEAIRHMFGLFGGWLRENVEVDEGRIRLAMEEIFSRLHDELDLIEDYDGDYDAFVMGIDS